MRSVMALELSPEEIDSVVLIKLQALATISLTNDYWSWAKERDGLRKIRMMSAVVALMMSEISCLGIKILYGRLFSLVLVAMQEVLNLNLFGQQKKPSDCGLL